MFAGLKAALGRAQMARRQAVLVGVALAMAALPASSWALQTSCETNPNGTRACQGTDSFNYAGQNNAGCPPAGTDETLTIDEEIDGDATPNSVSAIWGVDPAAVCGGLADASGVAYHQGDALRGGKLVGTSNGKQVWEWTVVTHGKNPGGDHPPVMVKVSYDRPPASGSGGGGGTVGGGTGGTGGGGSGGGECDWTPLFVNPPGKARTVPVLYTIAVHNRGTGGCPATTLTVDVVSGVATEFEYIPPGTPARRGSVFASPYHLHVPALAPDAAVVFSDLRAFPTLADLTPANQIIEVRARLPGDRDSPTGEDEAEIAKTKLRPQRIHVTGGQTNADGHGTVDLPCPRAGLARDRCAFKIAEDESVRPRDRVFIPFGGGQGTVPAGTIGPLPYKLNVAGKGALKATHRLQVTLFGERTLDGVTTLVEGQVTLRR